MEEKMQHGGFISLHLHADTDIALGTLYQGNFIFMNILTMWNEEDKKYMEMALSLAEKGLGHVNPNPMVGAVIVKDGKAIARGWHRKYGALHAETDALSSCKENPSGATMYVTLEPCCHFGKQPPCTSAIIEAGIAKVAVAMLDPNPLVAGRGVEILRESGIEVVTGLFEERARYLNRVFIKFITEHRPWVTMKYAMTIDGRIAAASGDSKWVSCEESRRLANEMRGRYMGIMAGKGTVMADNPMLNCRTDGMRQPARIIADSKASIPEDSAIALSAGEYQTILAHTCAAPSEKLEILRGCGIKTMECPPSPDGRTDINALLQKLGEAGIDSVFVEGGAELNWSIASRDLADEYFIFIAPKIIGGSMAKGPAGGRGITRMRDAVQLKTASAIPCGTDWLVHGFAARHGAYADICRREEMQACKEIK